jgi:acylglycerol lipase
MRLAALLTALLALTACAPAIQSPRPVQPGFEGAHLETDVMVAEDGARLPLSVWRPQGEPRVVIVALHGMNDSRSTWWMAGPWWAEHGVVTYAYDQRGFGGAPDRGVWAGEDLLVRDLRTAVRLARSQHPGVPVAVVGESLGSSVIIAAMASDDPPAVDRVVLTAPAVWGWSAQPVPNRVALWVAARLLGETAVEPPEFVTREIYASDNMLELYRMGRDPAMTLTTRFDAVYGLVDIMETASRDLGRVRPPVAYLYGGRDQLIAMEPTRRALRNLPRGARTAFYPGGHHLLTRDQGAEAVMADVLSFVLDPAAPWPSGAEPIPLDER